MLRDGSRDWLAATANAPVTNGATFTTGPDSRTELQLDFANVLRLSAGTTIHVAGLARDRVQIQLSAGLASFAVLMGNAAGVQREVEIDTPNLAVHPQGEGLYRIQVYASDYSQVTVNNGSAEVVTAAGRMNLTAGQIIYVKGAATPEYQIAQSAAPDDWDRWNNERNHNIADAQSWQYTTRYYVGTADLDRYGDWVQVPGYGSCWSPYVEPGWAPYRQGRWVADSSYQWVWVGYEPWAWAPYHYGRWLFYDGNWCWWPGKVAKGARPAWAPAYVAFLGLGAHPAAAGSGMEFDSIGWCPLGPQDKLQPWWGPDHVTNVVDLSSLGAVAEQNASGAPAYGSNFAGLLTDPNLRSAVSTASELDFANGRFDRDLYPVNQAILQQGSALEGPLPVTATKASEQVVERNVNRAALPPATVLGRQFFSDMNGGPEVAANQAPVAPAVAKNDSLSPDRDSSPPKADTPADSATVPPPAGQGLPDTHPPAAQTGDPAAKQAGVTPDWHPFGAGPDSNAPTVSSTPPEGHQTPGTTATPPSAPPPAPVPPPPPAVPQSEPESGWRHFGSPSTPDARGGNSATSPNSSGWKRFAWPQNKKDPAPNGKAPAPAGSAYKI